MEENELKSDFPEDFGFGLFDDVPEGVTHPLLIEDFEDEVEARRKLKVANIYKLEKGTTQLHRAIRGGKELQIKLLIEAYREDFDKVRCYLEKKCQWDQADPVWFKKTILVATSDEECRAAKSLETKDISSEDLCKAIFVLLQHPVDDEEVAILRPNESTRLSAIHLINRLMPNGFLSWNCVETEGKRETFMEAAASCGSHDVIDRLHELGAPIVIPDHIPLITACRSSRKDTIELLLTKHFDNFDCSIRNAKQENALIVAMQKSDPKMFDLCLEKMIAYRCKYYQETESKAFSNVFRFENEDLNNLSIFTYYRKGPISGSIDRAIAKYGMDLSYQWRGVTILTCMLCRGVALEYCFEAIRKDPKLLEMMVYGNTMVLHETLRYKHFEFLREMYETNPEVKEYFNSEAGFESLGIALYQKNHDTVRFILEHHLDFLKSDEQKLKKITCGSNFSKEHYDNYYKLFVRYFPEYQKDIEQASAKASPQGYLYGIERSFADVGIDVSRIDDLPQPLFSLRASKGETLLHLAVENDNQELFLKLIEAGCDLDTLDSEGNHPVHFIQSKAMLDLILDRHADGRRLVQLTDQDGFTVLHKICSLRMEDEPLLSMLEKVIELGADVHQLTNEGESVVFFLGSTAALEVFRKRNVPLDTATKDGETVLLRHLRNGNNWMARALLKHVHQLPTFKDHAHKYLEPMLGRNRDYFSCDYQDLLEKFSETTKLMFDSLFKHSRQEASRIFNRVCGSAHNFVSEKFLEFDYDLDYNYQDEYQYTAIVGLLSYLEEPNKHIVEGLLKKGVDVNIKNHWGRDALLALVDHFKSAGWYGHDVGTVQLLLDHGAAVNTTDKDGNTPLHLAFKDGIGELIEVLIRNGADVGIKNNEGKVPLELTPAVFQELFCFLA